MPLPDNPLVVILGPTAVGKTELSLQLAERLNGEIISADSRLFYRGMDIGTAKPTSAEQARVPHHLIDVADPDEVWSLAKFQRQAYAIINEIHNRGKLPFLVGGTGQYVKAVFEGWDIPEVRPDPKLRAALENWAAEIGSLGLYERLTELDPAAAARIEHSNLRRTIRALEVILHTGELFSAQKRKSGSLYRTLLLGLTRPRPELYARVDERIQAMLAQGLLAEIQTLLAAGYSPELPPMSAIGYRQMIQYLQGEISLDEAVMLMKRITRQFVRRQANWFKIDNPDIHWFTAGADPLSEMENRIKQFLTQLP
jgi:tRNA dimethylallyltransferase